MQEANLQSQENLSNDEEARDEVQVEESNNELSYKKSDTNKKTPEGKGIELLIDIALEELTKRKADLNSEIDLLSKRKLQIENDLKTSFLGQSDGIARKIKGFQDYMTGAFQDLVQSAEQLELVVPPVVVKPSPLDKNPEKPIKEEIESSGIAIADTFKPDENLIKDCLEQFLEQPDFYADPWKFRRSLELKDTQLLSDWFFNMGGRGAQPSRGNRPRNILVAAALISILGELYGDRFQTLVLASQPERLGEWRRCLQDALGLNREDFGPNSGIVLFERSDGLIERADRLEERGELPFIIIDAAEINVEIPILQFPIWLAFAGSHNEIYEEVGLV